MTSSPPPNSVTILYGSETGNAQDFAIFLANKLRYLSLKPHVSSLDAYPLKHLVTETRYLIIICSTTGQGDVPRNGKNFLKFILKKKLPNDLLNHIKFTTFGLGDSSYPKFNYAIKKLHVRLLQLGCRELCPRCESDEQSPEGIDGYYAEWETNVIPALQKEFPDAYGIDENVLIPAEYPLKVLDSENDIKEDQNLSLTRDGKGLSRGSVVSNDRITAQNHFQDVRHLVIGSDKGDLSYEPGDTLALYPPNDDHHVQLLLELQPHWLPIADKPLVITKKPEIDGGYISDSHLTLRTLMKYHLDIMSIPRRSFFFLLHNFVDTSSEDGQREKEKLFEFTSLENSQDLYDYANRPRRLILETIMEFEKNLKIPVEYVLDLFPTIKVRLFLIASKPSSKTVELLLGIVEYKTVLRRIRRGLCTKWTKQLQPGDTLVYSVHKSNLKFQLPDIPSPPVLMIAPGTGVAPMKSLIEHVAGKQELHLFYGCRYSTKDFLYKDLWENLEQQGLLNLHACFSRDEGSKVKYVQDNLIVKASLIAELILDKHAIVFVCGSSGNMPRQVRITLLEILKKRGVEEKDAEAYLFKMENTGRYIQETW